MEGSLDIGKLIKLRKLTREIAEFLSGRLRTHLSTLSPLVQPQVILGEHIRSLQKYTAKGADDALDELRKAYQSIYHKGPFNLQSDFTSPLAMPGGRPEITPLEYRYKPAGDGDAKEIMVTSPLKWVVAYAGNDPNRLHELIPRQADSTGLDLQLCVLHYLVMELTLQKRPGVGQILKALRFPVEVHQSAEFGGLPMVHASCPISTIRPADDVIIQSTEISGSSAFEEVVDLSGISKLEDPIRDKLVELVKGHGDDLVAEIG